MPPPHRTLDATLLTSIYVVDGSFADTVASIVVCCVIVCVASYILQYNNLLPPILLHPPHPLIGGLVVPPQIFIKTLTGRKQAFNFEPENQVLAIKQALQEKEGIQVEQIRLIYSGKQL